MSPPASQPAKPASQPATSTQPAPARRPASGRAGGNVNLPNLVPNSLPNSRSEVPIRVADLFAEFDAGFSNKCSFWGAKYYAIFFNYRKNTCRILLHKLILPQSG